jgi:insertion element IS1 protein InsB
MKCGRLWATKATNNGFGLPWMSIPAKSLEFILVIAPTRSEGALGFIAQCLPSVRGGLHRFLEYGLVFPNKRHKAVGKETGKTSYIERFNCTLRQRVSRLVRKTLSFLKKLENHVGAIWLFVHHYNASLLI